MTAADDLTDADRELLALKEANAEREAALVERTGGRWMPVGVDLQQALIYLRHLLVDAGRLVAAERDFEEWRAEHLDKAEAFIDRVEERQRQERIMAPPMAGPRIVRPGQ